MEKITSVSQLTAVRDRARARMSLRVKGNDIESLTQIYVGMGESGLAAGAKAVLNYLVEQTAALPDVVVVQSQCLDPAYREPALKVVAPGKEAVYYENVDQQKAADILAQLERA